jgi:hypothetical protein
MRSESVRKAMLGLINSFCKRNIIVPFGLMVFYFGLMIVVLHYIGYWNFVMFKDSILWFGLTGVPTAVNAITNEESGVLRSTFTRALKLTILYEFLVNFYTFSLAGELVLIPLVSLVTMLEIYSRKDTKYEAVGKLMAGFQFIFGLILLGHLALNVFRSYKYLWGVGVLKAFFLGPVLTTSFMPFFYGLIVYSCYNSLFVRLNIGYRKSDQLKKLAKRHLFRYCLLSIPRLKRANNMGVYNIMQIRDEADVQRMVEAYKGTSVKHGRNLSGGDYGR